ncbi:hypothetical protein [Microbacterium kunmingense]
MTSTQPLIEVHPCERHRGILSPNLEWFRALQIAEDCMDCKVRQ